MPSKAKIAAALALVIAVLGTVLKVVQSLPDAPAPVPHAQAADAGTP